jgi:peptide/nickel transport system substrate-binding protein
MPTSPARNTWHNVIAALVGAAAACSLLASPAFSEIKRGGTLVSAITGNPPDLMSGIGTNLLTGTIGGQVYDMLVTVDRSMTVQPGLAKSWEISPDGLRYTFKLRENVKWHDGKPFSATDVAYSFLEINRKYNPIAAAAFRDITRIETPDPSTVVIHIARPDPAFFPWAFAHPAGHVFPKHIYGGTDPRSNPANFKPIGTGPFIFKEWVRGSHISLERNRNYFDADRVYLDRLIFQIMPEATARQLALERGDVDHLPYFSLAPSSVQPLSKRDDIEVIDTARPALGEIIMFFNLRNEPLSKKEVRHAIAFGIDRGTLVKLALSGRGKVATGPIRSDNPPFYTGDVPKYPRDVARANALLDKAGYPRKGGGSRMTLRLSYEGSGEGGSLQSAAEIMREQLREIGINLQLVPSDPASWQQTAFIKWDFDMTMGSFLTGPDPKIGVSRLYLTEFIVRRNASNLMGYSNPTVDDLFHKGDAELNPKTRADIYHRIQRIMLDDLPALWLWEKSYPIAVRKGVVGLPAGISHWDGYVNIGFAK